MNNKYVNGNLVGGAGGLVVKPLGSKQEVPGSNPGAAESVGQWAVMELFYGFILCLVIKCL